MKTTTKVVSSNPAQARCVLDTTLCDKFCQWLATGLWFSPDTLVSSYNKTDCHVSETTGTDLPQVYDKSYRNMLYQVHLTPLIEMEPTSLEVIGTDRIGSYKSNYHTITTVTTSLFNIQIQMYIYHNHGEVYMIQHYVIKFVSDLQQVGSFLQVLRFSLPIKLTTTLLLKNCWKWC
jgi:hypothetical protein